jgi:hypothetical protein
MGGFDGEPFPSGSVTENWSDQLTMKVKVIYEPTAEICILGCKQTFRCIIEGCEFESCLKQTFRSF